MKTEVRLTRQLYEAMREDMNRPHEFAAERIGFFSSKMGLLRKDKTLILLTKYHPVPDRNYLHDPSVGASIDAEAIRTAMQRVIDTGEGAFHVHMHHRVAGFALGFSQTDRRSLQRLMPSFQAVGPEVPHGALVFDEAGYVGWVWLPGCEEHSNVSRVSIIGYPMEIHGKVDYVC